MQVNQNQLSAYIKNKKNSAINFFWINSEDNYLLLDAAQQIKNAYEDPTKQYEKIIFHIDSSTDWQLITNSIQIPGLFSQKQLVEINFINKITAEEQKELVKIAEYCRKLNNIKCLIIYPFRLESQALKQKWMMSLDKYGLIVTIWPPSINDYSKWLRLQCQKYHITFSNAELFDYFCQKTMGNPSIANQTLYKLQLQDISLVNSELLQAILSEHANYDIFDLVDTYLLGDLKQCLAILTILKNNHIEPLLILWAIRKELHVLANIYEQSAATKTSTDYIISNLKLWSNKTSIFTTAVNKFNLHLVYQLLNKIASIEPICKTENNDYLIWQQINELILLKIVNFEMQ
ncbi:MAG: DNA polymerase III subunit delta [Gammaproteobacteria bacterium]|nr:DNA polymerase III subunit delta [Gammaproteobacteria bacterium]